jgi:hypothetical protein
MATRIVPPGGFVGWAQQTVAVQALLSRPKTRRRKKTATKKRVPRGGTGKRTARRRPATTTRRATPRTTPASRARLKKGSPAAKRRMAQLRAMQKRNRQKR